MKASELIKELDSSISRCGDLEVVCDFDGDRRDVEFLGCSIKGREVNKIVVYCSEEVDEK